MAHIGILLTNTGTPDAPTTKAVKRYLAEFLRDKRIVHLPRFIWYPLLYGVILPFRSQKSARLYQRIWQSNGSPMRINMNALRQQLETKFSELSQQNGNRYSVKIGMNYGQPSISQALEELQQERLDYLILLPLYPQYSKATTASSQDKFKRATAYYNNLPAISCIDNYSSNDAYIAALQHSVEDYWNRNGRGEHLLISFHGIPERFVQDGDPYQIQCEKTSLLLTKKLNLQKNEWDICYQSRFGYNQWLKPATLTVLEQLAKQGFKNVDILCPGFSVDCLETLEEIELRAQEHFINFGGKSLRYIPALNACEEHVNALVSILTKSCRGAA